MATAMDDTTYKDPTSFPCPPKFDKIVPKTEQYFTHAVFRKYTKRDHAEKLFILLLTNVRFYKVEVDNYHEIWARDLIDIHSIEGDDPDSSARTPTLLRLVCRIPAHKLLARNPQDSPQQPQSYGLMDKNLLNIKLYPF
eukprot:TRINITY_DN5227_c0_g1_i1.p1 TRINITY_DN5227_c0_g1~~TRINITY_DN5227_c0_g1_i1.p1  ORF type:complete len:139 (+),score=24.85 TRINITY_DN5227_c0_g1_i1:185-601(+)